MSNGHGPNGPLSRGSAGSMANGSGNLLAVPGASWYKAKGRQAAAVANAFKPLQQAEGAGGSSSSSSSGLMSLNSGGLKSPGAQRMGGAGAKSPFSPNKSGNPLMSRKKKFRDLVGESNASKMG